MDPDQQIRAAAAQAASQLVPRGSDLMDYLSACAVIDSFIGHGWSAAITTFNKFANNTPLPVPPTSQSVGPQPAALIEPMMPPAVTPPTPSQPASTAQEWTPGPEKEESKPDDNVIPMSANKPVPPQQEKARRIVDEARKTRARSIMGQASIAKVRGHLENLITEAQDSQLLDFRVVSPEGEPTTLGEYLEKMHKQKFRDSE